MATKEGVGRGAPPLSWLAAGLPPIPNSPTACGPAAQPPTAQTKLLGSLAELQYRPPPEWMAKVVGALLPRLPSMEAHSLSEVKGAARCGACMRARTRACVSLSLKASRARVEGPCLC